VIGCCSLASCYRISAFPARTASAVSASRSTAQARKYMHCSTFVEDGKCVHMLLNIGSVLVDDYHCQTLSVTTFTC
jgi:hypothetical protein